jgi:hypothetical protein
MEYNTPPSFATGDYLSAYKLRLLANNDDHFNGVASRYNAVPLTFGISSPDAVEPYEFYNGWLFLTQNAIHYAFQCDPHVVDYGGSCVLHLRNTEGGGIASVDDSATPGEVITGSFDCSALDKNKLYNLVGVVTRAAYHHTAFVAKLYYAYEDNDAANPHYDAPAAFTDGDVSTAAQFTQLSTNDTYFRLCESDNWPTHALSYTTSDDGWPTVWEGHTKHNGDRLYYKLELAGIGGGYVEIFYNGGAVFNTGSVNAVFEGYVDVAACAVGTWYQVYVRLRHYAAGATTVTVHYLGTGPAVASATFTPLGEFMPGQFGWGTTATQRTRLELLRSNDADLNGRLALRNHAVHSGTVPYVGPAYATQNCSLVIKHLKNVLYYRGTGLTMGWGAVVGGHYTNSLLLEDTGVANHKTLDLTGLSYLAIGQMYTISCNGVAPNVLNYAMERES